MNNTDYWNKMICLNQFFAVHSETFRLFYKFNPLFVTKIFKNSHQIKENVKDKLKLKR